MQPDALRVLERDLAELARRKARNKLAAYVPYPRQLEFHAAGALHRERLFIAGNQLGKTWAGAFEMAAHTTGQYPDWWPGRRFEGPITAWTLGVTSETTRDNPQRLLVGPPAAKELWGTAALPGDSIVSYSAARSVADALDSVVVKHVTGGQSLLMFKSYERGREKLQGASLHTAWADEEPPPDVYTELLARLAATDGLAYITATPLLGMSEVVRMFLGEQVSPNPAEPTELAKPPGWDPRDDDPLAFRPPPKPPRTTYNTGFRIHR